MYIDPKADIKAYNKILMDPIRMYASKENSQMMDVSSEDHRKLLNYADAAIREKLSRDYTFVEQPGPGVMRLRIAITEAENSMWCLIPSPPFCLSGLQLRALKHWQPVVFLCRLSRMEVEMQDSQTGKRLQRLLTAGWAAK